MLTMIQNELRRPVPSRLRFSQLWAGLSFIVYWFNASGDRDTLRVARVELEADRDQIASQFEAHREANRSHAELVESIEVAQTELSELETPPPPGNPRDEAEGEAAGPRGRNSRNLKPRLSAAEDDLAAARFGVSKRFSAEMESARAEASQRG